MEAGQGSEDVPVLLVEVLEGSVLLEDVHPLPLGENHPDRAVLKDQPRFPFKEDGHLLVKSQLDKVKRQPSI